MTILSLDFVTYLWNLIIDTYPNIALTFNVLSVAPVEEQVTKIVMTTPAIQVQFPRHKDMKSTPSCLPKMLSLSRWRWVQCHLTILSYCLKYKYCQND